MTSMKLTVHTFLSVDGVMQGPGGAGEDTSGGFDRGGWLVPLADADMGRIVEGWFAKAEAMLLGRHTYETMKGYWTQVTDPDNLVATKLNRQPKYVVSRTLRGADADWANSTVLSRDLVSEVTKLKEQPGGELQVHGSAQLARSLHVAGLVDEFRILVFPVYLGLGKRLFAGGAEPSGFRLVDSSTTSSGAVYSALVPTPYQAGELEVVDGKEAVV
jgi:dihydrofolate reductase